jgi:hypothetical protein
VAIPNSSANNLINFPTIVQGGYTSLLLGLDQDASAARKLQFDTGANIQFDSHVTEISLLL